MGKILIKGLRCFGRHGVNDFEKQKGQIFVVDATLTLDLTPVCKSDALEDTVNYSSAVKAIRRSMDTDCFDTIEAAAGKLCRILLEEFPLLDEVEITLHKPRAPIAADFDTVSVCVSLKREAL